MRVIYYQRAIIVCLIMKTRGVIEGYVQMRMVRRTGIYKRPFKLACMCGFVCCFLFVRMRLLYLFVLGGRLSIVCLLLLGCVRFVWNIG